MQKWKPRLPYFLLLYLPIPVEAQVTQEAPQWKNEISATLLSLRTNYSGGYGSAYFFTIMSGISYRRNLGPHACRLGMDFRDYWTRGYSDGMNAQRYHEGKFKIGYQFAFSHRKVKIYTALDLIYLLGKYDSDFQGGYAGLYSKLDLITNGIGFGPALGLQYRFMRSLSISMETNYEFIWFNEKGTIVRGDSFYSVNKMTIPVDRNQFFFGWNPISSIALNFGF